MENIFDAVLFAVLIAAGGLGVTSLLMMFAPADSDESEVVQRHYFESLFFGVAGLIIMLVMWYAIS